MQFLTRLLVKGFPAFTCWIAAGLFALLLSCYLGFNFIPNDSSVYYYALFGALVQGFVGLVAFLGAIAVFQLQNHENEFRRLLDSIATSHMVREKTALWFKVHRELVDQNVNISREEYVQSFLKNANVGGDTATIANLERMYEIHSFEWEVRDRLTIFTIFSFLNVALALSFLTAVDFLTKTLGHIAVVMVVSLSFVVLILGAIFVRRLIGLS